METIRQYLSRLGKLGAAATNKKLTAKQRSESARRAALARWTQQKKQIESSVQETREGTKPWLAPSTSAQPSRNEPLRSHDRAHSESVDIDKRLARLDKGLKALLRDLKKWRRASDEYWKAYKTEEKPKLDQIEKLVAEITEGTKQLLKTSNANMRAALAHRPKEKKEKPAS